MKLDSLFPKQGSLTAGSTTGSPAVKDKKPSLFGGSFGGAASNSRPASTRLKSTMNTHKASGLFSIKWPTMPKQQAKDYQVITTKEEWIAYLEKCVAKGVASFDWETAPMQETRERWEAKQKDLKIRGLAAKAERDAALPGGEPADPKKPTPKEKRIIKAYDTAIKVIEKDYDAALEAFNRTPLDPWQGEICTLSISAEPHESRVIFLSHKKGTRNYGTHAMDRDAARKEVIDLLEELIFMNKDVLKVAYNMAFETKFAAKYGKYILGKVSDPIMMIVRCLQIVAPQKIKSPKAPHAGKSLKKMTLEYLGVKMKEFSDVVGGGFFDELSTDEPDAQNYSAEDSDCALQLHYYFDEIAKQIPNKETCPYRNYSEWLHAIEMPFTRVIGLMEFWGMEWNRDDAAAKRREAHEMQTDAHDTLVRVCQELADTGDFSEDQVKALRSIDPGKTGKNNAMKHILYDILKLPVASTSKTTGAVSLDNNAILDTIFMLQNKLIDLDEERFLAEELPAAVHQSVQMFTAGMAELPDAYNPELSNGLERGQRVNIRITLRAPHKYKDQAIEILETIQKIQKYGTLLSSHIEGREKYVNPVTNRIHAGYSPWTQTSRLSSSKPNGQNVPRMDNDVFGIRNLYKSKEGKVMTFIDFSGFELRLMAWRSNCDVMIGAISNGEDLHKMTAATLTGKDLEEITKSERSRAKSGNFGVNYGGTEHALQETYKGFGIRHTLEECKDVVDAVLNTYPGIPLYQRSVVLEAREDGYVETIYGYKRPLPDINHVSGGRRGSDERRAGNTPIQGAAADYMKDCQNIVYDRIGEDTFASRLVMEHGDDGVYRYEKAVYGEASGMLFPNEIIFVHGHFDMCGQVHDEIIFEADNDEKKVRKGMEWVQHIMEREPLPGFPVPIEAEASAGYTWGTKVDLDDWVCKEDATC